MLKELFPGLYMLQASTLRTDLIDQLDTIGTNVIVNLNEEAFEDQVKDYLESTAVLIKCVHFGLYHSKVSMRSFTVLMDHLLMAYSQQEKIVFFATSDVCLGVAVCVYCKASGLKKEEALKLAKLYEASDESLKLIESILK